MVTLQRAKLKIKPPRIRLPLQSRERELIALRKARRELEAKLQLQLAELDAKEENLMLDEQSEVSGRKNESHHSNI